MDRDPPRLLSPESGATDAARALLSAASAPSPMSASDAARHRALLESSLAGPPPGPGGGASAALRATSWMPRAGGLVGVAGVTLALGLALRGRAPAPASASSSRSGPPSPVPAAPLVVPLPPSVPAAPTAQAPALEPPALEPPARSARGPQPPVRARGPQRSEPLSSTPVAAPPPAAPAAPPELENLERESELLGLAQRSLLSAPARALAQLEVYDREAPPRRHLLDQRAFLEIDALRRLSRAPEASARAQDFLRRFPASLYVDQVRQWAEPPAR